MSPERDDDIFVYAEMTPAEIARYFDEGGDLAVIPIGSIEQHGPAFPLGDDGYFSLAIAREVARLSGGVVLPMVDFSWVGCTNHFPGGIGVREHVFIDYLRDVVRAVRAAGFGRIVVVNGHGGNFYAMRTFPDRMLREDGIVVLTTFTYAGSAEAAEARRGTGEGSGTLGALRMLGREDMVKETIDRTRAAVEEFGDEIRPEQEPGSYRGASALGLLGHDYYHECRHVAPSSRLDPAAGEAAMRAAARHIADALPALSRHVATVAGGGARA